ncbi:MAG TPA: MFS transporter [Candidatus Lustribacter sp.]|nr:MFS transporter [Candidatus Lustribacter sp.]
MGRRVWRVVASHGLAAVGMSLPWPLLMARVWHETGDERLLGLVGAARMLPYVAISWLAGRLADRWARDRVVWWTLGARLVLLAAASQAVATGRTATCVVLLTLTVAAGTPAYPSLAAGLPTLAGRHNDRATDLLVTVEVASFVVGPALGGLLMGAAAAPMVLGVGAALVGAAALLFAGTGMPRPEHVPREPAQGAGRVLRSDAGARGAIALLVVVNAVLAGVGIVLLPHAEAAWPTEPDAYGLVVAGLGFGALAAPVLGRLGQVRSSGTGLAWMGAGLLLVALAPTSGWALAPVGLVSAAAVRLESLATAAIQARVPDAQRASALGIADTAMVAAALAASAVAPLFTLVAPATRVVVGTGVCLSLLPLAARRRRRRSGVTTVAGDAGPARPLDSCGPPYP